MLNWLFNLGNNKELSLIEYFTTNKLTLPVRNNSTYSHANTADIEFLQKNLKNFSIQAFKFKQYKSIYLLNNNDEFVVIVDENVISNPSEIFKILFELASYKPKKYTNNIINFEEYKNGI